MNLKTKAQKSSAVCIKNAQALYVFEGLVYGRCVFNMILFRFRFQCVKFSASECGLNLLCYLHQPVIFRVLRRSDVIVRKTFEFFCF